ncbi:hypothetical protein C6A27_01145 [Streptococcus anginosus]|uniref:Uncharacterized protein n=1 Tax=Streptococcus anginosus TaxID=1328 RepID=A0A2T0G9E5_STRAP|nr:hypothetical protein [Streptococcus anginosus]PRT72682.1 hypothetical protein C6A27_01145 [Streptococcus anginosus]
MTNYNIKDIDELFHFSKKYAVDNDISNIIIFAKKVENVLKLSQLLSETNINLIVTTFPNNQVLYIENEDGDIDEVIPEILSEENRQILTKNNIPLISSTLPLDPVVIPGTNYNPYTIISQTLSLFGLGTDLAVQSALMSVDNGFIKPSERVLSLTSSIAVDLQTTNSRFVFHPEKGVKILEILK